MFNQTTQALQKITLTPDQIELARQVANQIVSNPFTADDRGIIAKYGMFVSADLPTPMGLEAKFIAAYERAIRTLTAETTTLVTLWIDERHLETFEQAVASLVSIGGR